MARVRVVGLGPGGPELLTPRTRALLEGAAVARLRTRVHPAAAEFPGVASYDEWYESADSFDALYDRIVVDLESLALAHPDAEVIYAVPGSPTVAESTVSRLTSRARVEVVCEPAVSVIDVVAARLGRDLMAAGVRLVDALDGVEPLRGPGPLLILQTYSPEVLALLAEGLGNADIAARLGLGRRTVEHHVSAVLAKLGAQGRSQAVAMAWRDRLV